MKGFTKFFYVVRLCMLTFIVIAWARCFFDVSTTGLFVIYVAINLIMEDYTNFNFIEKLIELILGLFLLGWARDIPSSIDILGKSFDFFKDSVAFMAAISSVFGSLIIFIYHRSIKEQ